MDVYLIDDGDITAAFAVSLRRWGSDKSLLISKVMV